MDRTNDAVRLCGYVAGVPQFSHKSREESYYKFPLAIQRLSGAEDVINILLTENQLKALEIPDNAGKLRVIGEVRSFNNRTGEGPRLVITVLARTLEFTDDDFENNVSLTGTICKTPTLRRTPMGREICDIMLAVNRNYGRSDYLPCIAWGSVARMAAELTTGAQVELTGRIQSRSYIKQEGETLVEKTAYEISAVTMEAK